MEKLPPLAQPRRVWPFAVAACFAFALVPLPPQQEGLAALVTAALLTAVMVTSSLLIPWRKLHPSRQALPPLAYFLVIALLRDAEGGAVSGYGLLVLLPVFWLALYGTRAQLSVALVMMVVMFALPIVLIGEHRYPSSEWRRALMWAGLGPLVGFTVQRLVNEREQLVERLKQVARTDALTGIPNRGRGTRSFLGSLRAPNGRETRWRLPFSISTTSNRSTTALVTKPAISS